MHKGKGGGEERSGERHEFCLKEEKRNKSNINIRLLRLNRKKIRKKIKDADPVWQSLEKVWRISAANHLGLKISRSSFSNCKASKEKRFVGLNGTATVELCNNGYEIQHKFALTDPGVI